MASFTIATMGINREQLQRYYDATKKAYDSESLTELDLIFQIALDHRDRFPAINLSGYQSAELYIERWVKGYVDAIHNPPSKRIATPKTACTDPAIRVIVKATQRLSEAEALRGEEEHILFMSAENIQGNLLEEYIAEAIRPYGFLWCDGNVLRAIDFCNSDGSFFLQVKNKSNTENSSSSTIREGTDIEKWYRLGTRTRQGIRIPDYKWPVLNEMINTHRTQGFDLPPCNMSEDDYEGYLIWVSAGNPRLITK